jgi:hypothetical protein
VGGMSLDFVILCLGRTGSMYLQGLLDSHPGIRCFDELFSDNPRAGDEHFVNSTHTEPREYVEELTRDLPQRAVGFKLPYNSLRAYPDAFDLLHDPELRVIRLRRENLLAQYVSWRLLKRTGIAHSTHGRYDDVRITVDPEQCIDQLDVRVFQDRVLDEIARGNPVLEISYEEIVAGERLEEVQRFLGVDPWPLSSWFEKLRSRPLPEVIENWDELADSLAGTPHERYLDVAAV